RDIRILGKARVFESEFVGIRFRMARAFYLKAVLLDMPRIILESTLVLFILGYVGVVVAIQSNTQGSIASLGLFGYAALRVLPSLNRITNNLQSLKYSRPLIDNLYADLIASDDTVEDAGRIEPLTFDSEIRFDDVSFLYEDDADFSIRGLQLTVNRGEFIGVIGPTGSGKTTLIDLLIGLLSPTAGQILVDGHDIQTNLGGWYAQIGLVSQSVTLIDDTLRRNIALGIPDDQIDETAVNEAVTVAQLSGFVQDLQLGLDTVVGEQGTRLSGGQRQRVAIARALYRRPQILVFDEGTSALDEDTEAALVESLNELRVDRTLVVVAHRMTTIQDCDRAVLLEDGVLVDQGRLVDVLRRRPSYRPTSARAG
ncbi:MAG TPA: ATP-binding cassette domain-containing protein, partial [Acidimicrobiales bacterium]|nr:ATP-binding cassette domain-containing protein [Acidimicrobiales bacterium]